MNNDILLVDKPKGITSFDVIRKLRKSLGVRKMGHAGTLDPLATGLLIVGIEAGTKKLKNLIGLPKTYETEILLGKSTTTGDMEGEIVEQKEITSVNRSNLEEGKIEDVIKEMVGVQELPVPIYSAIKKNGKPLYKYARKGEEVEVPVKKMEIRAIELIDVLCVEAECVLFIKMDVGSGTYVRSVAEEIGRRLGYPATVKELRRTTIGKFEVKDAITL